MHFLQARIAALALARNSCSAAARARLPEAARPGARILLRVVQPPSVDAGWSDRADEPDAIVPMATRGCAGSARPAGVAGDFGDASRRVSRRRTRGRERGAATMLRADRGRRRTLGSFSDSHIHHERGGPRREGSPARRTPRRLALPEATDLMKPRRIFGLVLLLVGSVLVLFGLNAADPAAGGTTSTLVDNSIWYLVAGGTMVLAGLVLTFLGPGERMRTT